MAAALVTIGIPQNFHVKVMGGAGEITPTTQMTFVSTDPTKATVAATGLQDCRVTPVAGNADGSPAAVTIKAHLPGSSQYSAFDDTQDAVITQFALTGFVFVPV